MNPENDSEARGRILVWAGVLLFAATGTVMRCLTNLGADYPIDGRNTITSCAILLVGNICAFLIVAALYGRTCTRANLAHLTRGDWWGLCLSSMLSSAIAPALTLIALESSSVTEIVLIGRLEPLLFLLLATRLLGVALDRWALAGAAVARAGGALALVLEANGRPDLGAGQRCAGLAAVSFALSSIISKVRLQRVPFGIFMVFRLGVGTALSFVAVWVRLGAAGFDHIFAPILWQSLVIYGAVFVVGAHSCWGSGLRSARPGEGSLAGG
jgi:drug/metabolite transporter (DMT)-like permease